MVLDPPGAQQDGIIKKRAAEENSFGNICVCPAWECLANWTRGKLTGTPPSLSLFPRHPVEGGAWRREDNNGSSRNRIKGCREGGVGAWRESVVTLGAQKWPLTLETRAFQTGLCAGGSSWADIKSLSDSFYCSSVVFELSTCLKGNGFKALTTWHSESSLLFCMLSFQ